MIRPVVVAGLWSWYGWYLAHAAGSRLVLAIGAGVAAAGSWSAWVGARGA